MRVESKQQIVPTPPKTFDITDLTQEQADWLFSLLGAVSASDARSVLGQGQGWLDSSTLYQGLKNAGAKHSFRVTYTDGVIKVKPQPNPDDIW